MSDLELAQMRLRHLQLGTVIGLTALIPALLKIGAALERRRSSTPNR